MSKYIKKTEEEKRANRLQGRIKADITRRLKKPMYRREHSNYGIYKESIEEHHNKMREDQYNQCKKERDNAKISQEASSD